MYVVCDDILTVSDPVYLWRFFDQQRNKEYLIELVNSEKANPRFDLFTLTLPTDLDLPEGRYLWSIYESETSGDVDYPNMNDLARGAAKVASTFTANSTYEPSGNDSVYNG